MCMSDKFTIYLMVPETFSVDHGGSWVRIPSAQLGFLFPSFHLMQKLPVDDKIILKTHRLTKNLSALRFSSENLIFCAGLFLFLISSPEPPGPLNRWRLGTRPITSTSTSLLFCTVYIIQSNLH